MYVYVWITITIIYKPYYILIKHKYITIYIAKGIFIVASQI